MREYWAQLRPRERMLIGIGGIFLLVIVLYFALLAPFQNKSEELKLRVDRQREEVDWLNAKLPEARQLLAQSGGATNPRGNESLLVVVDRTAKQGNLGPAIKRVEPDGTNRVRVWLENAVFDDVTRWLSQLEVNQQLVIESAVFDKTDLSGRVNVRLVFVEGGA